jgi:hypothetical protein
MIEITQLIISVTMLLSLIAIVGFGIYAFKKIID